ncbi:hypothetical protein [Fundidesulfovibrio putealis]|nr:hypothetical protein [Fundidesulfovibrio putealis]
MASNPVAKPQALANLGWRRLVRLWSALWRARPYSCGVAILAS